MVLIINDMTINIQFNLQSGEKRILQLVNAMVSHEMRNPLNSIIAHTYHLRENVNKLKS